MVQHEQSLKDRLEAAYTACDADRGCLPGTKQAIREHLEVQGFMVDLMKRSGTDREKVLVNFDLDRMLFFEQVRNVIIRNQ